MRGARGRQARLHREAARRVVARGRRARRRWPRSAASCSCPGTRSSTARRSIAIHDLIDSRRARRASTSSRSSRVNLGLHQPDVSVVWDLGPHDFSILRYWLERDARARQRDQPRAASCPSDPGRRLHQSRVRVGADRARRALVARAEQAAADDDRRLARRWSSTTTRATSRCASSTPASMLPRPGDVRRVPADLPHRRHRLAARSTRPSRSRSSCATSATSIRTGRARRARRARSGSTSCG